jgi:hypothetical protein
LIEGEPNFILNEPKMLSDAEASLKILGKVQIEICQPRQIEPPCCQLSKKSWRQLSKKMPPRDQLMVASFYTQVG